MLSSDMSIDTEQKTIQPNTSSEIPPSLEWSHLWIKITYKNMHAFDCSIRVNEITEKTCIQHRSYFSNAVIKRDGKVNLQCDDLIEIFKDLEVYDSFRCLKCIGYVKILKFRIYEEDGLPYNRAPLCNFLMGMHKSKDKTADKTNKSSVQAFNSELGDTHILHIIKDFVCWT